LQKERGWGVKSHPVFAQQSSSSSLPIVENA